MLTLRHMVAPVSGIFPTGVQLHFRRLGFRQSSLRHITRASQRSVHTPGTSAGFLACYFPIRPFGLRSAIRPRDPPPISPC